ncbi:MAG TPA: hypothetical protein VEA44_16130 [Caulobacter sp.]|nr:hypothetical protein [Caulobacter sp.]
MSLLPMVTFDVIEREELNRCLTAWGHLMGPCIRPAKGWSHGLRHDGELVAVVATDGLIRPTCAGFTRDQAVELSRVCAVRRDLCRVAVRLWREFVFRQLAAGEGYTWAVSYQDQRLHVGDLYRFDGWLPVATSRSGTDKRSGKKGRRKVIWAWSPDPLAMAARRAAG